MSENETYWHPKIFAKTQVKKKRKKNAKEHLVNWNSWPFLNINSELQLCFPSWRHQFWGECSKQPAIRSPSCSRKRGSRRNTWSKGSTKVFIESSSHELTNKAGVLTAKLHMPFCENVGMHSQSYVICIGISGMWGCDILIALYIIIKGFFFQSEKFSWSLNKNWEHLISFS